MGKLNKIGSLWLKVSEKTGKEYFSGVLEDKQGYKTKVLVFGVKEKKTPKHPDYEVFDGNDSGSPEVTQSDMNV